MVRPEDHFTNTPEDAAAFERHYGRQFEPDSLFEPDDDCEPLEVDEDDGVDHPSWCPFPPFHAPYFSTKVGDGWLVEYCEPA